MKLPHYPEYINAEDRVRVEQTVKEALLSFKPDFFSLSEKDQNICRFKLIRNIRETAIYDLIQNRLELEFIRGPVATKADLLFNWTTQLILGVGSDRFYSDMFPFINSDCTTLYDVDLQHYRYQIARGSDYENDRYTSLRWQTSGSLLIDSLHYGIDLSSVNFLISDHAMTTASEVIKSLIPQKDYCEELPNGNLSTSTDYFGLEDENDQLWSRYKIFIMDYLVELDQQLNKDPLAVYVVEPEFSFGDYPDLHLVFHSARTLKNIRLESFHEDCVKHEASNVSLEDLVKSTEEPVKKFLHQSYADIFADVAPERIQRNKKDFDKAPKESSILDYLDWDKKDCS